MIAGKKVVFVLHDGPTWHLSGSFTGTLVNLHAQKGVLFWCRNGEWRAIGGPRLTTLIEYLRMWEFLRDTFVIADVLQMVPDTAHAYDEWDIAIPVPAEVVRWLREEAEQLGEADTTADAPTE